MRAAAALMALAAGACVADADAGAPSPTVWAQVDRVVTLELDGEPRCLGYVVRAGAVLTAKHCVQNAGDDLPFAPLRLTIDGRATVERVLVLGGRYDTLSELSGMDAALLRVAAGAAVETSLGATDGAGAHVYAVSGRDGALDVIRATVQAAEPTMIYTTSATCGGNSGGPLFDASGALLGVASWRTSGPCGTGTSVFTGLAPHEAWLLSVW